MTVKVQLLLRPEAVEPWSRAIEAACVAAGLDVDLSVAHAPETVDVVVYAPHGPVDLSAYTNTKLVQGLWAGVESIIANDTLTQPYARMVDEGLAHGMMEWVVGHVMRHHLGMDRFTCAPDPHWDQVVPPLAQQRRVTVLGLGALGARAAGGLASLGFDTAGWSASAKEIDGVTCFAGEALDQALSRADILVLLLPATPQTHEILNRETLALLPRGAVVLNPGRGALIDEGALLEALDSGQLSHATLDTFQVEPLPKDHPFWAHPGVTVTPHIASETRPETASRVVADNIARVLAGKTPLHLVDKARGY